MKKIKKIFCCSSLLLNFFICPISNTAIQEARFIQQFFSSGDLVFDVGTNIGKKTDIYLYNNAKVVCIEPQPRCISILRNKYKNNPDVIAIIPKGLGNQPGTLELSICSSSDTISTFSQEWQKPGSRFDSQGYKWNQKINVEITTLDELIKQFGLPKFCKIDVENFEYEVLQGLSKPIPYISFEYAAEIFHNTEKCIDYLAKLGYKKFNYTIAEQTKFALHQWVSSIKIKEVMKNTIKNKNWNFMWNLWGDIYAKYE